MDWKSFILCEAGIKEINSDEIDAEFKIKTLSIIKAYMAAFIN